VIETSGALASILANGTYQLRCRVESWLGDTLLADDVPISTGQEDADRSLGVPERLTLTVPRVDDYGTVWEPSSPTSPLAAYGQRLRVTLGVGVANGAFEWLSRGWFLVSGSSTDSSTVQVEAEGLLSLIDEARLVAPYQPAAGSTFVSVLRDLTEPALTVDVNDAPADRAVPTTLAYDEDRLGAVNEVLDAWPAEARVTSDGYLRVFPATDPTSSTLALTDGTGGTVLEWQAATSRDDAFTCVVARGEGPDGTQVQGVVYETAGALADRATFNPLPVPFFYYSPLLTTAAQCRAAATTIRNRKRRTAAQRLSATVVPDPRVELGDCYAVTSARLGLAGRLTVVETVSLPYVADGGAMTLGLRLL
jgi:hypothetical protein